MLKYSWLVLILCSFSCFAQVDFYEDNSAFGGERVFSQLPVAISDINNDFLDDIAVLDKGTFLKTFLQHANTRTFSYTDLGKVSEDSQYALNIVDLDNDGFREILCGGNDDGIKVYTKFGDTDIYLKAFQTTNNFYTQNISFHDFNNDSYLDMLVCDDDAATKIFMNEGGDNLIEDVELIDFSTATESDNSGNYASIFTDFDNDGDLDLYISKCRQGANSVEDPRRINQLFVNNGDGSYSEQAADFGLANGEQTWVTAFEDLDNDGDMDIVMLNHTNSNLIFENTGDQNYVQRQMDSDFDEEFWGIQLVVRDFDNDGLKDIFIAGFESRMYWNKSNFIFERDDSFLGAKGPQSAAVGDLNNDGFWDIYGSNARGFGAENFYISDRIYLNEKNENNFIKISLLGIESNLDATGARCELFGEWGKQVYENRSGQSYGTTDSKSIIFGLGGQTEIDSLIISWPSGLVTKFETLTINEHLIIQENGCVTEQSTLLLESDDIVCPNSSLILQAPLASEYVWNNGFTGKDLQVNLGGIYNVMMSDVKGCATPSPSVRIEAFNEIEKPIIQVIDESLAYCKDDGLVLSTQYDDNIRWPNGNIDGDIYLMVDSIVFADYLVCDSFVRSDDVNFELLEVGTPEVQDDTIKLGDSYQFHAVEELLWYEEQFGGEEIYRGDSFESSNLLSDTSFYVSREEQFYIRDSFTIDQEPVELSFPPDHINGGVIFAVKEHLVELKSVKCLADFEGFRKIQIKDYFGNVLNEKEVFIGPSDSIVELDFTLLPFDYYVLTTDIATNQENLGKKSPLLKRAKFSDSPFSADSESGNLRLISSTGTPLDYYFFFDMKFTSLDKICISDRAEVNIVVQDPTSIKDVEALDFEIFPNPVNNNLHLRSKSSEKHNYQVFSLNGELLRSGSFTSRLNINVSQFETGFYLLKISDRELSKTFKFTKF